MTFPQTAQVVVIGGGNAALCAAISAREAGAEVILLEHADKQSRGGNSKHTRNLRAMHRVPNAFLTDSYSSDEYLQDLLRVTKGNTDLPLATMMINQTESLLAWLQQQGVEFQPSLSGTLSLGRTNAFFLGGGKALVNTLYHAAERAGVKIFYHAEVTDLTIENASVTQINVLYKGFAYQLTPQVVIAASGGFQANRDWMRDVWGEAADNFIIRGTPFNRGTVLKALLNNGATQIGEPSQCHAVAIDARAPKYDGGIVTRLDCVCFSIVVNNQAQRFYDEGEDFWPKRYAIWGRLVAQQPNQIAFAIIDSKVVSQFMPSVFPSIEAPSIAELAAAIDLPPAQLTQTVAQFNAAVQTGEYDPGALDNCCTAQLSPPKSHWALAIDTPPFYAYPLRPGITFTYLGVKVDEQARVLLDSMNSSNRASNATNENTDSIPASSIPAKNLFACGEIMAGNILGQGYCAGTGMSIGGVFGRIAGQQAAELVLYASAHSPSDSASHTPSNTLEAQS